MYRRPFYKACGIKCLVEKLHGANLRRFKRLSVWARWAAEIPNMIPVTFIFEPRMRTKVHRRDNARHIRTIFGGVKRDAEFVLGVDRLNKQGVLCVLHKVMRVRSNEKS